MVSSFPFDGEGTEFFFGKVEGLLSEGESLLTKSRVLEFIDSVVDMWPIVSEAKYVGTRERGGFEEVGYSSDHLLLILMNLMKIIN